MSKIAKLEARTVDGEIVTELGNGELADLVMEKRKLAILKNAFPPEVMRTVRQAVHKWGLERDPVPKDDFSGNYHRCRAMVSNIQKAPHVFHDYNFNDFSALEPALRETLFGVFEPLRRLYNSLTSYNTVFGVPASGPYLHPQLIQYPVGGGFFARHWHNLLPQKLGFILAMSKHGEDYPNGGTVFDIDGEVVSVEGSQDIGDLCIWRYDYHHWVTQSDLQQKFDWNAENGRWVATLALFDPY